MENRLNHANSFKDLEDYKQSKELAYRIYELTKSFPAEEKYSLTMEIYFIKWMNLFQNK